MYNHAPENYKCPICIAINGQENDDTLIRQDDIFYKDESVTAFIGSFFIGKNSGHPIIVPNVHYENVYDIPAEVGAHIFSVTKRVAVAVRNTYDCEGISTLQNNEPIGGQHAFHYHLHVFPRYENDDLHVNMNNKRSTTPGERLQYAEKLRSYLKNNDV